MSQSKKKLVVVLLVSLVLALASMACGGSDDVVVTPDPLADPTVQDWKDGAAETDSWVVTRNDDGYDGRVGIFVGTDMQEVTVRTDKHYQMDAPQQNLFIRERDAGSDDWVTVQEIKGNAGDYIVINTDSTGVSSVSTR